MDYYNLLEIPLDATTDEIRRSYFLAAKKFHPDKNPNIQSNERFILIQKAYDVLIDPIRRKEYDEQFSEEEKKSQFLKMKLQFSRSAIPIIEGSQKIYTLLDISTKNGLDPNSFPPINICLVIDRSTSMQGELLEKIKFEAINLLRLLRPEDMISVIAFSDRAEIIVPPTPSSNLEQIIPKIQTIQASGATEIFQGLSFGVEVLRSMGKDNDQIRQLILLTDGHTYGDEDNCYNLMREAHQDGITLFGIGVGDGWNDQFLDKLTQITGGETQFVSTAQEMYNSLIDRVVSAGVVLAHNVQLSFETNQMVKLNYVFRYSPGLSQLAVDSPIALGNLQYGKHLRIIFEFEIDELPVSTTELKLLRGVITMDLPSLSVHRKRFFVDFNRTVKLRIDKESPPAQIIEAMSHLTLYRIQEKAQESIKLGDMTKASKHLHHMATHLLAKGDRNLAHTVLKEAEFLKNNNKLSDLGEKKIKYGTRALLLLPEPEMD
ncbi:MAG: hypothetical protein CL609_19040 [Anaerolineaceae bacterium]|nr:hypothetical protein [Anaerolineaceae bacterium]